MSRASEHWNYIDTVSLSDMKLGFVSDKDRFCDRIHKEFTEHC